MDLIKTVPLIKNHRLKFINSLKLSLSKGNNILFAFQLLITGRISKQI